MSKPYLIAPSILSADFARLGFKKLWDYSAS